MSFYNLIRRTLRINVHRLWLCHLSDNLQSMIRIRSMREDRAATDLTRARRARTAAERTLREKAEAVERYEETKEERRDRVYDAVIGHAVKMEALDQARDAVNRIDEEGVLLEEDEKNYNQELILLLINLYQLFYF